MYKPQLQYRQVNGARLAYFESGQAQALRPSLVFVHATGFHGRIWDYLAEAFADLHIIALDLRGHGRSESLPVTHWRTFGEDIAALAVQLGLHNAIGIGHSMGAHGLIDGAAISGRFANLLLLDPTVADPQAYQDSPPPNFAGPLHPASKRRSRFESVAAMQAQMANKASFPLFLPRILADYCEHGLLPVAPGLFELACRPAVEAHVYMTARTNGQVYQSVRQLEIPVTIVRAKLPKMDGVQDFSSSPTWPSLAGEFRYAQDMHWADSSHFIPMQKPDLVIAQLQQIVSAWG